MGSIERLITSRRQLISFILTMVMLFGLMQPMEASATYTAPTPGTVGSGTGPGEKIVTSAALLKAALENKDITTIYLGEDINLRQWGRNNNNGNNINSSSSSNSYDNNAAYLMTVAVRSGGKLTINGTDPRDGKRHTYTDRRTNDRGSVPIVMPNTAMTFTLKDIDIYGYNYWGIMNGSDSINFNIVFDGVYGIMSQFLHFDAGTVTVRNSILKVRDTGLRAAQEFFECSSVIVENNVVFDHQPTDNCTFFWLKNSPNNLTVADGANVTMIERGYNEHGIFYDSARNSLTIGDNAKLTSILAEQEGPTGGDTSVTNTGITYTSGYNRGSSNYTAAQSEFTFSGSRAQTFITIGKDSELNIIHPYNTTNGRDILRTTASTGITVNEGGILNVYSKANNSRVLNLNGANLTLNNPRMVTLYTESTNSGYLFNGTIPLKASKLKSIRYYNTFNNSYTFPSTSSAVSLTNIGALATYTTSTGAFNSNRNPDKWLFQYVNSFDVTSANINGTGTVSYSTYQANAATGSALQSITSDNLNASQARVLRIDGDYSRRPTIDQAEAGQTVISGTGVPGAKVNLYDPSGNLIGLPVTVSPNGTWQVNVATPLVAKTVYSATQQASIAGHLSSPSTQVTMTIRAKAFHIIASNNTEKTYMTGYINAGFNNIGKAPDYSIKELKVIIFNDPDKNVLNLTQSAFEAEYNRLSGSGINSSKGGIAYAVSGSAIPASAGTDDYLSVGRLIPYNCTVLAQAIIHANATDTALYDTVRYKNIFTPYPVWMRAVIAGIKPLDMLYDYETVNPTKGALNYGIPYMGDGKTVYNKPIGGYDSVLLTVANTNLAHKDVLVGHWEAKVGPAAGWTSVNAIYKSVPYPLKLDNNLGISPAGLYDITGNGTDKSKYTLNYVHRSGTWWENAPVKFVDKKGVPVSVTDPSIGLTTGGVISIPLIINVSADDTITAKPGFSANNNNSGNSRESFRMIGGRYTPPSDSKSSPIGWYVGTTTSSAFTSQSDFSDDTFNPVFQGEDNVLYIVYNQSMFQVTEEYYFGGTSPGIKISTDKVQYFETTDTRPYEIKPKRIEGYLPTGWAIGATSSYAFNYTESMGLPTANQYDLFPTSSSVVNQLSAGTNVIIKYFYTLDDRHNGIPNNEEVGITIRWRGTTVDNASWAIQPFQTIYGREGYSIKIPNNYPTPGSIGTYGAVNVTGDGNHKIKNTVVPLQPSTAVWIFDEPTSSAVTVAAFTTTQADIYFDYAFSTNGTDKDKDQYVTENYYVIDNNDQDNGKAITVAGVTTTATYIIKDKTYSKAPPDIDGYIYVGYRWNSSPNAIVYQNGLEPVPVTKLMEKFPAKLTFLYRKAATGSVTANWIGKTYAGSEITFNTVNKRGYEGEIIIVQSDEVAVLSDWKFVSCGAISGATHVSTDAITFTMNDTVQTGVFTYSEVYDEVTITAKYESEDGSFNATVPYPKVLKTSADIMVSPMAWPGYALTGWVITDRYGITTRMSTNPSEGVLSVSAPVAVHPKDGTQTITFRYTSTLTNLYIRCFDKASGVEIGTAQAISNVSVGDTYYANAPIVSGYALVANEPLIKGAQVMPGSNTIRFDYETSIGKACIIMEEGTVNGTSNTAIGYRIITVSSGTAVSAPALESVYYRPATGEAIQKTFQNADLKFVYTKDMINVMFQPIDQDTGSTVSGLIAPVDPNHKKARKGEMYEAVNDIDALVKGYTLTDTRTKRVYADPKADYKDQNNPGSTKAGITVNFKYKADVMSGNVTVTSYYGNNPSDTSKRLGQYTLKAVVGGKLTVEPENFPGFEVTPAGIKREIIGTTSMQSIDFQYVDVRKVVNIEYKKLDAIGGSSALTPHPALTSISAVSGTACTIEAPYIDEYMLAKYEVSGKAIQDVSLGQTQINIGAVTQAATVTLYYKETSSVISGELVPVSVKGVSGQKTLYEYTLNRVKNSGIITVSAMNVYGYAVSGSSITAINVTTSAMPNPLVFQYKSLSTNVTIKAIQYDGTSSGSAVPGFSNILVPAVKDQPFSYNAPYIPGWNLVGSVTASIAGIKGDGSDVLTFRYAKASGNITIVMKEENASGRVIKTTSQAVSNVGDVIPIPDLTSDHYITKSAVAATVAAIDTAQTVEYYYEKDMRDVGIKRYVGGNPTGSAVTVSGVRIGEVSSFNAPVPQLGYRLDGDPQKLVMIYDKTSPSGVRFNYVSILDTDLVVNAVYTEGTQKYLLYTYTLSGTEGQSATVPASPVAGYTLAPNETSIKTGTFGSTPVEFVYVKNVSVITVKLTLENGTDITYMAPASYATSIEVPKGQSYTVVAPNLRGYVLAEGESSQVMLTAAETANNNNEVRFKYRAVSDLYVTHTITGKSAGITLYTYSFSVLQGEGSTSYNAALIPGYFCGEDAKSLSNNSTTSHAFTYTSAWEKITIFATSGSGIAVPSYVAIEYYNGVQGEKYSVRAPYIEGYALDDDLYKTITVSAIASENAFKFNYRKINTSNTLLYLKETGKNFIQIIEITSSAVSYDENRIKNLLVGDYFTYDSSVTPYYYNNISSTVSITYPITNGGIYAGKSLVFCYNKQTRGITIQAVDASKAAITGAAVGGYKWGIGEMFPAVAFPVLGYSLDDQPAKSVYVPSDSGIFTVEFKYKKDTLHNVNVTGFYKTSDSAVENILFTYTVSGTAGSTIDVVVPEDITGWKLKTSGNSSVLHTIFGDTRDELKFEYVMKTVNVTVKLLDENSNPITAPNVTTSYAVQIGTNFTVDAPYVPGYVLKSGSEYSKTFTNISVGAVVIFNYIPIASVVDEYTVNLTVIGDSPGGELYRYTMIRPKNSGTYTVKAFDVNGYRLKNTATSTQAAIIGTSDSAVKFEYISLATTVAIRMVDAGTDVNVAAGFNVAAMAGQPFTYNAPDVPGYYLTGSSIGVIKPAVNSLNKEITFQYKEITGNGITIIAKENNKNGRVIKVVEVISPAIGTHNYTVPDLTGDFYTPSGGGVLINWDGTNAARGEAYYTKDTTSVSIKVIDSGTNSEIVNPSPTPTPLTNQRKGEAVTVSAPDVHDYVLVSSGTQVVIANGISAAAFTYRLLGTSEVAVKAVALDGTLLQTYVMSGTSGDALSARAPEILGWKLAAGQPSNQSAKVGTNKEIVFKYDKNTVAVNIELKVTGGGIISAPAGYPLVQTVQADVPVTIAPAIIPGYSLISASDNSSNHIFKTGDSESTRTITFTYARSTDIATITFEYIDSSNPGKPLGTMSKNGPVGSKVYVTGVAAPTKTSNYTLRKIEVDAKPYTTSFGSVTATYGTDALVKLTYTYNGLVFKKNVNGGSGVISNAEPSEGEVVTLTLTPDNGYELDVLNIKDSNGNPIPYTPSPPALGTDGTYKITYTQTSKGAVINYAFKPKGSKEAITVVTENGSVTTSPSGLTNPSTGETVTLIVKPNTGYDLDTLTITGKNPMEEIPYTKTGPASDGTYTVTYEQPANGVNVDAQFKKTGSDSDSLVINPTENGSVTADPGSVSSGDPSNPNASDTVKLIITPDPGYDLNTLTITGKDPVTNIDYTITGPAIDGTYTVTYTQPANGVTVDAIFVPSVVIMNTVNGKAEVDTFRPKVGNTVTITLTPDSGYKPGTVTVETGRGANVELSPSAITAIAKNPNGTYTCTYVQPTCGSIITVGFVSIGNAGAIIIPPSSSEGSISMSPATPKPGDKVTLTITPKDGYDLDKVSIKESDGTTVAYNSKYDPATNTYTVTYTQPDDAVTIGAIFRPDVTINASPNGSISVTSPSGVDVKPGDTVIITPTPGSGYELSSLTVTGNDGRVVNLTKNPDGTTYSYKQPQGGVVISSSFTKTVSVKIITTGTGIVKTFPSNPKVNETVTVVVGEGSGYMLSTISAITSSGGALTSVTLREITRGEIYEYKQPEGNVTISAVFVRISLTLTTENASVTLNPANPKPGEDVKINAIASYGYKFNSLSFIGGSGSVTVLSNGAISDSKKEMTFTWPIDEPNLRIELKFIAMPPSGSSVIVKGTSYGSVSVYTGNGTYPSNAISGDTITFTATPSTGYMVDNYYVTDMTGTSITVTPNAIDGTYSYSQPSGTSYIEVTFIRRGANITVSKGAVSDTSSNVIIPDIGGTVILGSNVIPTGTDDDSYYCPPGERFNIIIKPDSGYSVKLIAVDGEEYIPNYSSKNKTYTATSAQPSSNSAILVEFIESVTVSVELPPQINSFGISPFAGNPNDDFIEISNTKPEPGETVIITGKNKNGYKLKSLYFNGKELTYIPTEDGSFTATYTQPEIGGSQIVATYVLAPVAGSYSVVTVAPNGTATLLPDQLSYLPNDTVTVTVTAGMGYTFDSISVQDYSGNNVPYTTVTAGSKYTFQQPANNVVVVVTFKSTATGGNTGNNPGGGGGGGGDATQNSTTKITASENGDVFVDKTNPKEKETVVIYPKPDAGYELDTLTIKDSAGRNVPYTKNSDGTYSYIQPAGDGVTITATFKPVVTDVVVPPVVVVPAGSHSGYVNGYEDGTVKPNKNITRAEAASIIFRIMDDPNKNAAVQKSGLKDINSAAWYAHAVDYLISKGIFTGYPDGTFQPNKEISRAECTVIIARLKNLAPVNENTFSDVYSGYWAAGQIGAVHKAGWINGYPDGTFMPKKNITRAEMITMVNRMLGKKINSGSIPTSMYGKYKDLKSSHWAFANILEASVVHEYTVDAGGYEKWIVK